MKSATIIFILLSACLKSQEITTQPLITIPGQNKNLDIPFQGQYACFENLNENTYSIFLQRIYPSQSELKTVVSDTIPHINPTISKVDQKILVVWQSRVNGFWQLFSRVYSNEEFGPIVQQTHDSFDNTNPTLSWTQLFWIKNNNLATGHIFDTLTNSLIIDSINCANPSIRFDGYAVVYEKGTDSSIVIKRATKNSHWNIGSHTNPGYYKQPKHGHYHYSFIYSKFEDDVWKASIHFEFSEFTMSNSPYNIINPFLFAVPYVFNSSQPLDFPDVFIVYESDSIAGNKEIIFETLPQDSAEYPRMNISNSPYEDIKPFVEFLSFDSIGIFWESVHDSVSQIWWAKAKLALPGLELEDPINNDITSFFLKQNYPNPFNSVTQIQFSVPYFGLTELSIYNILGERIDNIISEKKGPGLYAIEYNSENLSSGIYYYVLRFEATRKVKKMVVIK